MSDAETPRDIDVDATMARFGIDEEMASTEIEAHEKRFTVAEAIAKCPPFVEQLEATLEGLEASVPDKELRKTILSNVVKSTVDRLAVASAAVEVDPDFLEIAKKLT